MSATIPPNYVKIGTEGGRDVYAPAKKLSGVGGKSVSVLDTRPACAESGGNITAASPEKPVAHRQASLLNKTEARFCDRLRSKGYSCIYKQQITLALDPPFTSYRPDLAVNDITGLTFYEVKGPHRFREKGIAKAALAAKTYPQFRFILADLKDGQWKETLLTP